MAAIGQLWRAKDRDEVIEIIDIQNKIVVAMSRTTKQKVFLTIYGLERICQKDCGAIRFPEIAKARDRELRSEDL